jgi:hypothetical protein
LCVNNRILHDCDLFVKIKKATLQMTAQDSNVMIARIFYNLPLALKLDLAEWINGVKNLVEEMMFYDKSEYFGHKF